MRTSNRTRSAHFRAATTLLALALAVAATMQPVHAALTALADVPIASRVAAKPNIFYTLDDSGSMQYNYIPDYVASTFTNVAVTKITRVGTLATVEVAATATLFVGQYINIMGANEPEYNGQFAINTIPSGTTFTIIVPITPITPATGTITYSAGSAYCRGGNNTTPCSVTLQGNNTFSSPPFFTSDFNRMMYNPLVTYAPPLQDTGLPVMIGGVTDASGNMGTTSAMYGAVQRDVFLAMFAAATKDDLRTRVSVPLYCNTDWPVTAGVNLAITDIGTVHGQYAAGTGAYCRINGTAYDASAASGAPEVSDDYNYPYQSSSGATGAQYFYRAMSNKTIYCDTTSPYYPRGAVIGSCNAGVPVTATAPTVQTCNQNARTCDPVVASRVYTTAAPLDCRTNNPALFCAPDIGGSDGNSPGTGALPECQACTCNATYQPAGGTCSSSGATCTGPYGVAGGDLAECPNVSNVTITSCTGGNPVYNQVTATCTALMFDPVTNTTYVPNTSMLADANSNGVVCRHNNMTYAVMTAAPGGLFSYPRTGQLLDVYAANKSGATVNGYAFSQKGNFDQAITSGCPTVGTTILIPRHYYTVDSVQFCDNRVNVVDDKWRGFGTGVCSPAVAGPIPGKNDLTKYKNVKYGQFHRRDLYAAAATVTGIAVPVYTPSTNDAAGRSWLPVSPTPSNSEQVNYANWYAMYATRLNAAKTTTARSFANLTTANVAGDYRVGFQNLGEEMSPYGGSTPLIYVPVADWTAAQRLSWYTALFRIKVNNFKTPTIDALIRIGALVETAAQTGLDPAINTIPGAIDPIPKNANLEPVTCTNNYHVLFTDGTTNQSALPGTVGDRDATLPVLPPASAPGDGGPDQVVPALKLGGAWPRPFVQGAPAVANTLSDVATYYWARDLRPAFTKKNVPSWSGKGTCTASNGAVSLPCDMDWERDVAWWPHVSFSAISFGAEGVLDATSQTAQNATMAALFKGMSSWPDLTRPNNPTHPLGNGAGAVAVDDLWHATVNSRGQFVAAKNSTEIAQGLGSILASMQNQQKSRSAAAFDGPILNATNNVMFKPTVEPGWAGDLLKTEVDTTNGAEVTTWWKASAVLAAQIAPASIGDEPWMLDSKRRLVTLANTTRGGMTAGPGVPFTYGGLSGAPAGPAMLASLASTALQQKKVIAYLRGGSTYNVSAPPAGTVVIEGTGIGQFRKRFGAIGDITNAQPVVVSPDTLSYVDTADPGYASFVAGKALRGTFIVAPANDGIVHVIDAGPVRPASAGGGNELFGFIPKAVFRGTAGNIATEDTTAIQSLTYQDGGAPIYRHHFFVDSSPRVADVDFGNGTGLWHTIAVGGLGKGGNSYYAIDITDPFTVTDEATAASKVMWEWTDADVRYTYGRPVIVKVRETGYPTGRWVVIVTSSYNNVSGHGKFFFLDAKTGELLSTITTSAGTATNPSGLAQIHAFVNNQSNQTAEQIYGGDLLGNVWRIDVSAADSYKTAPAVLFAQLTDTSGVVQPVTTAPQIEIDMNNGIDRYVFIGTGRLLDATDLTTPSPEQQQTMYAIRDGTLTAIQTSGLPIQPRVTMKPIDADGVSAIVGGAPEGWYHDLPNTAGDSERIVTDVIANANAVAYIGTQMMQDPCVPNLPAILYVHDFATGESLLQSGYNGSKIASQLLSTGGIGIQLTDLVQADGSQTLGGIVTAESGSNSTVFNIRSAVTGPGARMSWRLLTSE